MAMLAIVLILVLPFVAFSGVAVTLTARDGITPKIIPSIIVFLIPIVNFIWGIHLVSKLRSGFIGKTRICLISFYSIYLCYCGFWVFSPIRRNGETFYFFPLSIALSVALFWLVPLISTYCTKADFLKTSKFPRTTDPADH